ncbi:hypothetical protein [Streptococcus pneumoniae]|uniref:hypothetical protein n=1 Tax=Streptococcus pneumoniae TaxID=1313 RepID=UPI0017836A4F|nr:hypothetical protein [Streptococcus pneumoniae]
MDKTDEVSSKHCFEVVDRTDEVSSKTVLRLWIELTKSAQNTVLRLPDKTDEVSNIYLRQGEADLV